MIESGNQLIICINQGAYGRAHHLSLYTCHLDVVDAEVIGLARRVEVTDSDVDLLSGIGRKVDRILGVGARAVPFLNHSEIGGVGIARSRNGYAEMLWVRSYARHVGIAGHKGDASFCCGCQARSNNVIVGIEWARARHP